MRVIQIHNYYQQTGGEDAVVANERALLVKHGHEVKAFMVSNDEVQGLWRKVKAAWQVSYSMCVLSLGRDAGRGPNGAPCGSAIWHPRFSLPNLLLCVPSQHSVSRFPKYAGPL